MIKEKYDLEIEIAVDGQIAVDMYTKAINKPCGCDLRAYRLIIMDLGMPNMDGEEASRQILKMAQRERAADQDELTHIVVLTAFSNKKTLDSCHEIGIKKVYSKPLKF